MECEGDCENHEGEVRQVHVIDKKTLHDWGLFEYCDSAINEDRGRGFEVNILIDRIG